MTGLARRFLDALRLELLYGTRPLAAIRMAWSYAKHGDPPAEPEPMRDTTEDDDDESEAWWV